MKKIDVDLTIELTDLAWTIWDVAQGCNLYLIFNLIWEKFLSDHFIFPWLG